MRGVVAAGDEHTAEAARIIFARGGGAVDAAVAGAFAAFVTEPLLASAGGAGMMTLAFPDRPPAVVDFFSPMPGLAGRPDALDFGPVEIDFGSTTQTFHIGRGSVAAPLALPGLIEVARTYGSLPLEELVRPAVRMAREGVDLSRQGAEVFRLLWAIQTRSPEAVALAGGAPPREGAILKNAKLADFLEELASLGATPPRFREGLLSDFGVSAGGLLCEEDLDRAKPRTCAPRELHLGDWTFLLSPRIGGARVATIVEQLAGEEPRADEAREALRVAEACRAGHHLTDEDGRGSTTHISTIDAEGAAAALTLTNGEGCGYHVPGTGIQANNFLGEDDLNPGGYHLHPAGAPLPTMIAPTVGLHHGRPALALGSGGSNRIRSVVGQVVYRIVRGQSLEDAVEAPRIHAESDDVWIELAGRDAPREIVGKLGEAFERVHPFDQRAFYFGGVHAVQVDDDGQPHAVGDDRRGGAVARA